MSNENGTCDRCDKFAIIDAEELHLLREKALHSDLHRKSLRGDFGAHVSYKEQSRHLDKIAPLLISVLHGR